MRAALSSAVFVSIAIAEVANAGGATPPAREQTHIPAEPLGLAIRTLAKERGFQVVYVSGQVDTKTTRGVSGNLTADEALTQLLSGTGYTFYRAPDNGVVIVPVTSRTGPASAGATKAGSGHDNQGKAERSFHDPFRLAQADQNVSQTDDLKSREGDVPLALQTIIVTAQKYAQPAYEVPAALQVIGASTIESFGALNLSDLRQYAPGVSFEQAGVSTRIFIDGVSSDYGTDALTALYMDDADITASPNPFSTNTPDIRTYDTRRIEVLHGPQGTLYGEGAEGGAVHFVTNGPDLYESHAGVTAAELFTLGGQPSEQVLPVLNIPLVDGTLGLRFAGEFDHIGGYIDQPQAGRNGINSQDLQDGRIQLEWHPFTDLKVRLMQIIHRNTFGSSNTYGVDHDDFTFPFGLAFAPSNKDQYQVSNATISYDLPRQLGTLTETTTYYADSFSTRNIVTEDVGYPIVDVEPSSSQRFSSLTDELRESGGFQAWHWVVGGFYKHVKTDESPQVCTFPDSANVVAPDDSYQSFASNPSALYCATGVGEKLLSFSSAVYADVNYKLPILDRRITVGAGGRYFHDEEEFDDPFPGPFTQQDARFTSTDPRYYASFKVNDHVNTYLSAAKGFRSGGFNLNDLFFGLQPKPPYQPDELWRYEGGIKLNQFRNFNASLSLYFDDWRDYQTAAIELNASGLGTQVFVNAGKVYIKGVDAFVTWASPFEWAPLRHVIVTLNGAIQDGYVASTGGRITSLVVGDRLEDIPAYTANFSVEKDFRWFGRDCYVTANYYQQARQLYTDHTFAAPGFTQPGGYTLVSSDRLYLLNLALGVQWNDWMNVSLKASNLLNDRGFTQALAQPAFNGGAAREQPLTAGLYLTAKF